MANTCDISMRIVLLNKYDIIDVFSLCSDYGRLSSLPKNILSFFSLVTVEDMRDYNYFHMCYGQDFDIQNLPWSSELLKSSCEQYFLDMISEKLVDVLSVSVVVHSHSTI